DHLDWGAILGLGSLKLDLVVLDFVELTQDQSLHFADAVQEGRNDEVQELLLMPADPNIDCVTAFNDPPLLWLAASRCLLETAGLLLEARANVNAGDPFKCTPLCAAVTYHGDWDMIQLLIKADADILLADDFGRTALWCAANHGRSSRKRGALIAGH
ncbi:ASB14, partial [Symbiodinium sp. CCMP2456]